MNQPQLPAQEWKKEKTWDEIGKPNNVYCSGHYCINQILLRRPLGVIVPLLVMHLNGNKKDNREKIALFVFPYWPNLFLITKKTSLKSEKAQSKYNFLYRPNWGIKTTFRYFLSKLRKPKFDFLV